MQTFNKNVYVTCIDLLSRLPVSSPHLIWISKFFMSSKVPAQHSSVKICYKHLASYASSKGLKLIIRLSTKYYIKSTHIVLNTAENRLHNCSPLKKKKQKKQQLTTILGKNRRDTQVTCHNMTTQIAVFVRYEVSTCALSFFTQQKAQTFFIKFRNKSTSNFLVQR